MSYGYKRGAPISFNISQPLQRTRALDIQEENLEQRRSASEDARKQREMNKVGKLTAPWSPHAGKIQEGWDIASSRYGRAIATGDRDAAAEAKRVLDDLRMLSQVSAEYGKTVDKQGQLIMSDPKKYIAEDVAVYDEFVKNATKDWSVDPETGEIFNAGESWTRKTPFIQPPRVGKVVESVYDKFAKNPTQFQIPAGGSETVEQATERRNKHVASLVSGALVSGLIDEEDAELLGESLSSYWKVDKLRYKPSSNSENTYNGNYFGDKQTGWYKMTLGKTTLKADKGSKIDGGEVPTLHVTWTKQTNRPPVSIPFFNMETGGREIQDVEISSIKKVGDRYLAEGQGYQTDEDEWTGEGNVRSRQKVKFFVDDENKTTIEDAILNGHSIESFFSGKGDSKKESKDDNDPLGLGI